MQISIKKDINYCTYYIEITAGRSGETRVILKWVHKVVIEGVNEPNMYKLFKKKLFKLFK